MVWFALRSWFCGECAPIAWFGVFEMLLHIFVEIKMFAWYVGWQGELNDLVANAVTLGGEGMPKIYDKFVEMIWYVVVVVIMTPAHACFKKWWCLHCDQAELKAEPE